ncbi:MAG: heme A synthase [Ekhidna sp.]
MTKGKLFLIINSITLGSVLVLILIGGIVRSTGAGMGCPDWPKCFGSYIPPTTSDQLPSNYLEVFKSKRLQKNERLASIFERLGYSDLSKRITSDPSILQEEEFNVTKAWIEYVNRLVGVLIGLLVFLNMIFSLRLRKGYLLPSLGVFIFVLTGFQGWVGSLVVSTNLLHGFITFHMLLALLIVALLIWMGVLAREKEKVTSRSLFYLILGLFILVIPQVILGTEVRGEVDDFVTNEISRDLWLENLSFVFLTHRSYSWLILIVSLVFLYLVQKQDVYVLVKHAKVLLTLIVLTALAGIGLANFEFPYWLQPLHLLLATSIFSLVFYLTLRIKTT